MGLYTHPGVQWLDGNGRPLAGGKLNFYLANTGTRLDTYSVSALTPGLEHTNPVIADANGVFPLIWMRRDKAYKVVLTDANDVLAGFGTANGVGPYIDYPNSFAAVTNIAAMTALSKAALTDGVQIQVSGYTTANDGGGGTFYWHAGSSTTVNPGTVFATNEGGTGRWKRIFSEALNVRWFGAKGDNTTNDTTACQAAKDYAWANNLGDVYFPAGTYKVSTLTHVVDTAEKGLNIIGAGRKATKFTKFGAGTAPIFDWQATGGSVPIQANCNFRDFSITGNASTHDGIKTSLLAYFEIDNVYMETCNIGINCQGSLLWAGRDLLISNCNYGLYFDEEGFPVASNQISIRDSSINGCSAFAVDVVNAHSILLDNVDFESNGEAADAGTGAIMIRDSIEDAIGISTVTIRNCWTEGNNGWGLTVGAGLSTSIIAIENSHWLSSESGQAVRILSGGRVLVSNCYAISPPSDVISISSSVGHFTMINSFFYLISDSCTHSAYINASQGSAQTERSIDVTRTAVEFTPLLEGTSAAGAGTYTTQVGRYSVIGNQVFFRIVLAWNAHTGTGNIRVNMNNIPYTAKNSGLGSMCVVKAENLTFSGQLFATVADNSKIINIETFATGAANGTVAMDTAASLALSGWYDRDPSQ